MTDTKACEFCGTEIVRPASAEARDWRERRFCNTSCASRARRKVWDQSKPCDYCGKTIHRKPTTQTRDWDRIKFCGMSCANGRRKDAASQPKTCEVCRREFHRPDGYNAGSWAVKKTCSEECRASRMRTPIIKMPDESRLRDLYFVQRLSCDAIAQQFSVCDMTVKRWLRRLGIKARNKGTGLEHRGVEPPTKHDLARMIHGEFLTYREVARMYGVDTSAVSHWLKKHDIPPSQNGGKYSSRHTCDDGKVVKSSYEKEVANWFHSRSIYYRYEVQLPGHRYRADFKVNGWFVEVWGMFPIPAYVERMEKKLEVYRHHELPLIELFPNDFGSQKRMTGVLSRCLVRPESAQAKPRQLSLF